MRLLFLVTNDHNLTAANLIEALHNTEHQIDVVPYYNDDSNQCHITDTPQGHALVFKGQIYSPSNYDGVMLWCWGTAALGRKFLKIFEDQGVEVLNSTEYTKITDSKIDIARVFKLAQVPSPVTLVFEGGVINVEQIQQVLGEGPYVFKADYGTQGLGVEFPKSIADVEKLAQRLLQDNPISRGFILQEFIGNPNQPITHYRLLVIGDEVIPITMKVTAKQELCVSNVAAGGQVEFIPLTNEMREITLAATRASGLRMAGVDLMMRDKTGEIVVLEVNDGPGTKTFDQSGYQASHKTVQYFLKLLNERYHSNNDTVLAAV